jgi:hypothetical protein
MKFIHKEIVTETPLISILDQEGLDGWEAIYIQEYHGTRPSYELSSSTLINTLIQHYTSTRIVFKKAIQNDGLNYGVFYQK